MSLKRKLKNTKNNPIIMTKKAVANIEETVNMMTVTKRKGVITEEEVEITMIKIISVAIRDRIIKSTSIKEIETTIKKNNNLKNRIWILSRR
jgi:hypothetical protein